jgi:hypothetical protein
MSAQGNDKYRNRIDNVIFFICIYSFQICNLYMNNTPIITTDTKKKQRVSNINLLIIEVKYTRRLLPIL